MIWLSEFEKQARNFLDNTLSSQKQDNVSLEEVQELSTRLSVLEEANGKLQAQVQHYKMSLVKTVRFLVGTYFCFSANGCGDRKRL